MRDPEMLFEIYKHGEKTKFIPTYWRNDYAGVEQYSVTQGANGPDVNEKLQREHAQFAGMWDRNLRDQAFLEAFQRQHKPPQTN
jgi:hypothetical protein